MEKQRVYLWGFRDEDVQQWPEAFTSDVELVFTTDVPSSAPVVVHGVAAERFQAVAMQQASPDGRLPDAILYLPHGMEAPSGAWTYFDATVHEGDWDTLRALLACPQQFQMAEMADDLPVAVLKQLTQPVEALAPADLPLHTVSYTAVRPVEPLTASVSWLDLFVEPCVIGKKPTALRLERQQPGMRAACASGQHRRLRGVKCTTRMWTDLALGHLV